MEIGYKYVSTKFRSQEEASMHLIVFLIIGGIAGALAGRVVSGHGYGVLMDVIVGVIGAFVGGWLLSTLLGVSGRGVFIIFLTAITSPPPPPFALPPVTPKLAGTRHQTRPYMAGRSAPP